MVKMCNFCGNKNFISKNVQYIYKHDGKFLVVNGVPCEECEFCGEQYFHSDVLKKVERDFNDIYLAGKKAGKEISVPVEEFVKL